MSKTVYVIDSRIANYQTLIDQLPADADWFLIGETQDGLAEIAKHLAGYDRLNALHILSHGRSGALYLGGTELTTSGLDAYATLLAQIGSRLSAGGDILLYGCDVAFGVDGLAFITRFAALTGADVAASSDTTGSADVQGNWDLEASVGEVETRVASFSVSGVSLDVFTGTSANDQLRGTSGEDTLTGGLGDDRLTGDLGNDSIDGGDGQDTAVFSGNYADYQFTPLVNGVLVNGADGRDLVVNVEKLQFADQTVGVLALGAAETRVNTYVNDTQMQSKTVALADGSWVVIWSSAHQDGSGWGVFGQLYSSDGVAKGGEFIVNTTVLHDQTQHGRPAQIVALKEGGFAVVWDAYGVNGAGSNQSSWNIRGQIFDANAKKVGDEFYVTKDAGEELAPAVTQLANGNLVVTWESDDGSGRGIFGQVLTSSGSIIGNKFAINTNTNSWQTAVEITALADGGWLAVWRSDHNARIQGQRYNANGAAVGEEVNLTGNMDSRGGAVIAMPDGGWLVTYQAWFAPGDNSLNGVFSSRYNSAGALVGDHVLVNSGTEFEQYEPSVSALKDGGWIVVWTSNRRDSVEHEILGQRYDAQGNRVSSEFQVNTYKTGSQYEPAVVGLSDGGWVVTWTSSGQDGSNTGIYSQRYTADGMAYGNVSLVRAAGTGDNEYTTMSPQDVFSEAVGGGFDTVKSSISWTMSENIEKLVLTGAAAIGGTGNALDNEIIGNAAANTLTGGGGNDTLNGGAGDDTIDGGSGYNTLVLSGVEADYIIPSIAQRTADGFAISVSSDALGAGINDGTDTIKNIQKILFSGERDPSYATMILDDYSNAPDAGNIIIDYGKTYSGNLNFRGDLDFFKLVSTTEQKISVEVSRSRSPSNVYLSVSGLFQTSNEWWNTSTPTKGEYTLGAGTFDLKVDTYNSSDPFPGRYSFIIRRQWTGTSNDDVIVGDGKFEHLLGGAGNDSLTGGANSDRLEGETGNDVLRGNGGDDYIEGGSGYNKAVFSGKLVDYSIAFIGNASWRVTHLNSGADGVDILSNVHELQFSDQRLVVDDVTNSWDTAAVDAFTFGQNISGQANFLSDTDWFQFNFGNARNIPLGIRIDIANAIGTVRFVNSDGVPLTFRDQNGNTIVTLNSGQTYSLTPIAWQTGDSFAGGRVRVEFVSNSSSVGTYTISIGRELLGTAIAETLVANGGPDKIFEVLRGLGGNDVLNGSAASEQLFGGDGDDQLNGDDGNDFLQGGTGTNTVNAGAGDDIIDVSGRTQVADVIDGGAGIDALQISSGVSLSSAQISNVEVITSTNSGTFTLTSANLTAWGVNRLENLTISMAGAGTFDASSISGNFSVTGSIGNDIIRTGAGNNFINPRAGQVQISAGGGNDTIHFQPAPENWQNAAVTQSNFLLSDAVSRSYSLMGAIDGGPGSDVLEFSFVETWEHAWGGWTAHASSGFFIDLSKADISGIETLKISGNIGDKVNSAPEFFRMTTEQLAGFSRLENVRGVQLVGGGTIDLAAFTAKGGVNLTFGDNAGYTLIGSSVSEAINDTLGNDTLQAGAGDDQITSRAGIDQILGGAGNDAIILSGKAIVRDQIDGGEGSDTLRLEGDIVDLSKATINSIETIQVAAKSLSMTQAQWNAFGGILQKAPGASVSYGLTMTEAGTQSLSDNSTFAAITGTAGADTLTGNGTANTLVGNDGNDVLNGGAGDDRLFGDAGDDRITGGAGSDAIDGGAGIDTAVFENNYSSYKITPLATGLLVSGPQGTDVLTSVERLSFADVQIDVTLNGAAETRVNTYVNDTQMQSKTVALADGSWVVIWSSVNQDGSGWGVFGQLYGEDGTPKGNEFRVNTNGWSDQTQNGRPAQIVALKEGGFAVVWDEYGANGAGSNQYSWNIRGQIFDASAKNVGDEFYVTKDAGGELAPAVTQLVNGNLVVTWQSDDGSGEGIFGQVLTSSGSIIGNKFAVNTNTNNWQNAAEITALADGGWLAVWRSDHNARIQGQRYNANGAAVGEEVNLTGNMDSRGGIVVAMPDGGWIFAFHGSGVSGWETLFSRYDASGNIVGEPVRANSTTLSDQFDPALAILADGGWVIAWTSDGQDGFGYGVYAQRYNADGSPRGSEVQVNTYTRSAQSEPAIAALKDGGWVVTWTSSGQDGSNTGIYSQRYTADGLAYGDVKLEFVGLPTNDRLIGDGADNTFAGGAGDDYLAGGGGNDLLISGAGLDTLVGDAGDDRLVVTDKQRVSDFLDGGIGRDTLEVADGMDLTGATISRVEVLKGKGMITLRPEQLVGLQLVDGLTIQLSGTAQQLALPEGLTLANGARILLPVSESVNLPADANVVGTRNDDLLSGSAAGDVIFGGRGADTIFGGGGDDVIYGGSGSDILSGGEGNDRFIVPATELNETWKNVVSDRIDGGSGTDTLEINWGASWQIYSIADGSISSIENISLKSASWSNSFSLSASQWRLFSSVAVSSGEIRLDVRGDGGDFSFSNLAEGSRFNQINLQGVFRNITTTNTPVNIENIQNFDSMTLGSGADRVVVIGDSQFTALMGGGNDTLIFNGSVLSARIDGGAGDDILDVSGSGFVDMTQATLTSVETVKHGTASLLITKEQAASLPFDGSGRKFVKDGAIITGTGEADSFNGSGIETFLGGGGNDNVSNVNTFVLTGNSAEYDFARNGNQLVIEHARGSIADGKDTLTGVMFLKFADGQPLQLDDAQDQPERFFGLADRSLLTNVAYDKSISAKKDYASDSDVFKATLVPNSPLAIEASSRNGSGWSFTFWEAATGQQLVFKSLVNGSVSWQYSSWMGPDGKWLPGFNTNEGFKAYSGGEVVFRANFQSDASLNKGVVDYAFTLKYLDDYAGSIATTATLDPQLGFAKGYIGDQGDSDWIGTVLIAGTKYEFNLTGLASGGGTLVDPKLVLRDSQGREVKEGIDQLESVSSLDDTIVFVPQTTGTYFLSVTDVAGVSTGSWTLTQKSRDMIAGNVSTTSRADWGPSNRFSISSEINALTDHDWFRVWLDKGVTYDFKQVGAAGGGGTLVDPLLALRSSTGILVAQGDTAGDSTSSRITFSAPDTGWYFLDAGAFGNGTKGTYSLTGSTLVDDFAATILTQGAVQADGIPASGLISFNGDSDWFRVGLSKGQTYVIELVGDITDGAQLDPLVDPFLIIRDKDGRVITQVDDFNGSLNPRAYFTPTADGLYFVEAKSAFRFNVGAYQLKVGLAPTDDFAGTLADASSISMGVTRSGDLATPGDRDMFKVVLEAGKLYQIGLSGLAGRVGTLVDPHLRIFDAAGKLVDFNANGGVGNDAQLYFAPKETGPYYIEAAAGDDRGMGTYVVQVHLRDMPVDDYGNDLTSLGVITPGQSVTGSLLTQNDTDWFKVTLEAGKGYVLRLQGATSGNGTLADPVLEIRNADGTVIQTLDNGLMLNEPAGLFTPALSGIYYLVARAADGAADTGSYKLTVRAPDDHGNTRASATSVRLGDETLGAIQWNDGEFGARAINSVGLASDMDEDWFSFTANKDDVLSFTVQLAGGSQLSRPMVEIIDSDGRTVGVADGLETVNGRATATFKAPSSGAFYARIVDGAGGTGSYIASLTAGDASDEDAVQPVVMQFSSNDKITSATATAKLGLAGDKDSFNVAFQADHSYRIEVVPVRDGTTAPLPSGRLSLSWQAAGSTKAETIDITRDYGTVSFFDGTEFTAPTSGVMSLVVSADEPLHTGQYRVRIIDLGVNEVDARPDSIVDYDAAKYGVLAANENIAGKIDSLGDTDLYAIDLTAGQLYDFSIKGFADGLGTLAQANLKLLDASGQLVSAGKFDNGAGRTDLAISVFETGRYYLSVTPAALTGNTGTYTLDTRLRDASALPADDISADSRSGVSAAPGRTATGAINYAGDSDWIRVSLEAGKVYVLDVLADGDGPGGTLKDAVLRLLDSNGNELSVDDNSGAGNDARLQFSPPSTGTYYLDIGGGNGATGTYTVRVRELYSGVADPLRSAQWYLDKIGVDQVEGKFSGAGVKIGMIDDGIDTTHPDLQRQIDYRNSYDTVGNVADGKNKIPYPTNPFGDFHGTAVAGIMVAEEDNETGIVGVAPDALVASIRVKWSFEQITEALGLQYQFDVSNNSWGTIVPFGDNFNTTSMTFAYEALRKGVDDGRGGKGTVFVFSAGNSAAFGHNTNYSNFTNAREVLTVGAVNEDGTAAAFSTPGANVLVGAYGVNLLTTDRREPGLGLNGGSNYTGFTGTSAAAPVVSGIVALMLEANPNLGYRDVQQILAYSTVHPGSQNWKANGASNWNLGGLRFNDNSGFGIVNAASAVALAQTWTQTDTAINEAVVSARSFGMAAAIPDAGVLTRTFTISNSLRVEHIELGIDFRHTRLGDLIIEITSPSGTVSTLMNRPTVNSEQPFGLSGDDSGMPTRLLWDFSSVQFWGEDAAGQWTISVRDVRAEETGSVSSLSLRVYGERDDGNDTYVFTDEGFVSGPGNVLADEEGTDTINASPVGYDMYADLTKGILAANGVTHRIEAWSLIENAITGKGADRLVGNSAANTLNGRSGNDILEGGAGNDILIGGSGADTAVYAGNIAEFGVSWNPNTKTLTVVDRKTTNGNEGTDTLTGIERLVFADGEINLAAQVGNKAPVAVRSMFEAPVVVGKGVGLEYSLPEGAFTDDDGQEPLSISVTSAAGGELPEWLSYDPETGKVTGVPPSDLQGQIKLLITATDSFGQSVTETVTLQFGDNQAPTLDAPKELTLLEDAGLVALQLTTPVDPDGKEVEVTILEIPSIGSVLDKNGNAVLVGSKIAASDLQELHYQSAQDANGAAGLLRYEARDADGVTAQSSVRIFIDPVNDAPRFATASSKLIIRYPEQNDVALDLQRPTDPETVLASVRVVDLPALGQITLDGKPITINQVLTLDQLNRLRFVLSENVNGPIGALTIQATDAQGASTNWSLGLEVQGASGSNEGTSGNDDLFGSIGIDILYGYAGNDTLVGNAGNDRLLGGLGDDRLFGGSGDDQLDGSSGNDYLDGGSGNDTMSGGPGNDTYVVESTQDVVLEVIAGGAGGKDTIVTSVSLTAPANVENLIAEAGAFVDLTGNSLDNGLSGNERANQLRGGAGRDVLFGFGGNDLLDGGTDIDRLVGGSGDDIYYVDTRFDEVVELSGEGYDTVYAASSYTLSANVEKLILSEGGDWTAGGNSLDNWIVGNSGNNILSGGLGKDTLEGGLGDDIYVLSDNLDTIIDTGGVDTIRSSLDILLPGFIENAELVGISDASITGNGSGNRLVGNAGNNILDGMAGVDTLTGGNGSDQFIISWNGPNAQSDIITDFKGGQDLLVLDLASFGFKLKDLGITSSGLVTEGSFLKGAGVKALDPNDYFLFDTAQNKLFFDVDGSGSAAPVELVQFQAGMDPNLSGNGIYVVL
jgi:Ca2+-binding RTX toxin-like protein/subtilisin-like proprotein convertase family protein